MKNFLQGLIIFIIGFMVGYLFPKETHIINDKEYLNKIDSLEFIINNNKNIIDSVNYEIDTIFIRIKDNKQNYEQIRDSILDNTVNEDLLFFSKYIQEYNK